VKYSPSFFGVAFACALPAERAKIRGSLRRLLGRRGALEEHVDVVRTFVAYAHCLTESLAVERPEAVAAAPRVHGEAHLRAVLEGGRGAIIATAHAGAWDAAARFLARDHRANVLVVMARESDSGARGLQDVLRERSGVRVAHVGGHPLDSLKVLGHLRRGGLVAVQLDRIADLETAMDVTLGGHPFRVPAGPFRLAKLANVPILPVFTRRTGYFRHEVEIQAPIHVASGGEEAIAAAAEQATRAMERFLTENPTQWFHFSH
jgi:KDO2-lipid IV(A) lauroyltransferase